MIFSINNGYQLFDLHACFESFMELVDKNKDQRPLGCKWMVKRNLDTLDGEECFQVK